MKAARTSSPCVRKLRNGQRHVRSLAIPKCRRRFATGRRTIGEFAAIADDLGHGEAARSAAIKLSSNCLYEDAGVMLLSDIRSVFQVLGKDRIASAVLVEALLGLDDGIWGEWRGPNDDRLPRKLNESELARLLRPFQIGRKRSGQHAEGLASGVSAAISGMNSSLVARLLPAC